MLDKSSRGIPLLRFLVIVAFDLSFDRWVVVSQERKWGECSRQREEGSKAPRHDPAGSVS